MTVPNVNVIFSGLRTIGLRPNQLSQILPGWWNDAALGSADGAWELAALLSRRLSLDLPALLRGEIQPRGAVTRVAYKHNATSRDADYAVASLLASSFAEAVLAACAPSFLAMPSDPRQLRAELLRERGSVDFDRLLDYCWSRGIPVIPMRHLPVGVRKMDGAVLNVGERPVIVLARKNDSKSWLSFILAHELGHIASGHLERDSAILEVNLQKEATYAAESHADAQESLADAFALALLGGSEADEIQLSWGEELTAASLAAHARAAGKPTSVAAGHLVLRYAFRTKRWPEASTALKFLDEDFEAQEAITAALRRHLDLELVAPDLQDLLSKATGAE